MILTTNIGYFLIIVNRLVFLTETNYVLVEAPNEFLYRSIIWTNVGHQLCLQVHAGMVSKFQVFTACF
jgi:hypothetical protein